MGNLETVFNGFENVDVVPSLFVFMGNFCSHPCNLAFNSYSDLRSGVNFSFMLIVVTAVNHRLINNQCKQVTIWEAWTNDCLSPETNGAL